MTHKLWLQKQKLNYNKNVFDIIQFGSSTIENKLPNDVDIAVLFQKIPLKEQLAYSQEIKKQLQKITDLPIHIKSFDLYSFFDSANFTRENILFHGISLIDKKFFSEKLGFIPKIQLYYSLEGMNKNEKIKFNYMLSGRGGKYGLLKKYNGKLVKPGLIEISPNYENIFTEKISALTKKFRIKKILVSSE